MYHSQGPGEVNSDVAVCVVGCGDLELAGCVGVHTWERLESM